MLVYFLVLTKFVAVTPSSHQNDEQNCSNDSTNNKSCVVFLTSSFETLAPFLIEVSEIELFSLAPVRL
jgi:hypothetical protein